MSTKSFFKKIKDGLQNTEMFERPRKKLPGKWMLYEYFSDVGDELLHFEEADIDLRKEAMTLEILGEGQYLCTSTLAMKALQNLQGGEWSVSKNFITFLGSSDFRNNLEFQFAFEKGNLKLLKIDAFGKIEFFGFFKKLNS